MIRLTAYFSGQVQGVGFRWNARDVAGDFAVAGYVRNLDDGRVELVLEGDGDVVRACLAAVQERMRRYLRNTQASESPATGEFGAAEPGALVIRP